MSVRAKFTLTNLVETTYDPNRPSTKKVVFHATYDPSIPEDQSFSKATPWGQIEMQVDNPAALEQLVPGRQYYVDFTPVPPPEPKAAQ